MLARSVNGHGYRRALALVAAVAACGGDPEPLLEAPLGGGFAGVASCARCHPEAARRWRGSAHDLAMQVATPGSVLGNFAAARFERAGVVSHFSKREDRFAVRTEGADGALHEYEVAFTLGVDPLQQYLVRFPGGRLQALDIAWDTRPPAAGGQRWFDLRAGESVFAADVLHWTGPAGNWNSRCASCHSTGLSKGYSAESNRFETRWAEIDVSCEACHGPGARHVAWAEAGADPAHSRRGLTVWIRDRGRWHFAAGAPIARRSPPAASRAELESCAPCHARRSRLLAEPAYGGPFLDSYRPALLDPGLYRADGQIQAEVYEYGSFLQSRMYAAGVTCSDCHDPHTLSLRGQGDALCAGCHRPAVFASPDHHHHPVKSPGARCVACHMPGRRFMVIDERHDHSFRVPRPDLTLKIAAPNTCNGCHDDRSAAWATAVLAQRFGGGRSGRPHYGEVLHAARTQRAGAERALAALAGEADRPAIVRATALSELRGSAERSVVAAIHSGLRDPNPLVRAAALRGSAGPHSAALRSAVLRLLEDPLRAVRIDAIRALVAAPEPLAGALESAAGSAALAEYRAAQRANAEWPEAHVNLGLLFARRGEPARARRELETALRLGPHFVPAYINLADLHRGQGRDDRGERVLRRGLERVPDSADLQHALGLLLVRERRSGEALAALRRAAELAPADFRYGYAYALALRAAGQRAPALKRARGLLARSPREPSAQLLVQELVQELGREREEAPLGSRE